MDVALAAAADTFLNHASDNNPHVDIVTGKREVGSFIQLLRDINDIEYDIELTGSTDLKIQEKENKIQQLTVTNGE